MSSAIALNLRGLAKAVEGGLPSMLERAPAALREAADEIDALRLQIERLRAYIRCERQSGQCVMVHIPEYEPCTRRTCHFMGVVDGNEQSSEEK